GRSRILERPHGRGTPPRSPPRRRGVVGGVPARLPRRRPPTGAGRRPGRAVHRAAPRRDVAGRRALPPPRNPRAQPRRGRGPAPPVRRPPGVDTM
ncbi:MAG: hypothetical protein AVDCRST_MAG32-2577, partial [uncultured Nocardioides sp.]